MIRFHSHLLGLFEQLCRQCTLSWSNLEDRVAAQDIALLNDGLCEVQGTQPASARTKSATSPSFPHNGGGLCMMPHLDNQRVAQEMLTPRGVVLHCNEPGLGPVRLAVVLWHFLPLPLALLLSLYCLRLVAPSAARCLLWSSPPPPFSSFSPLFFLRT